MLKEIVESGGKYDFSKIPDTVIETFVDKIIVYEDRIEWHMEFDTNEYYAMKISGKSNIILLGSCTTALALCRANSSNSAKSVFSGA